MEYNSRPAYVRFLVLALIHSPEEQEVKIPNYVNRGTIPTEREKKNAACKKESFFILCVEITAQAVVYL